MIAKNLARCMSRVGDEVVLFSEGVRFLGFRRWGLLARYQIASLGATIMNFSIM
jgi:hypothetical protein